MQRDLKGSWIILVAYQTRDLYQTAFRVAQDSEQAKLVVLSN